MNRVILPALLLLFATPGRVGRRRAGEDAEGLGDRRSGSTGTTDKLIPKCAGAGRDARVVAEVVLGPGGLAQGEHPPDGRLRPPGPRRGGRASPAEPGEPELGLRHLAGPGRAG